MALGWLTLAHGPGPGARGPQTEHGTRDREGEGRAAAPGEEGSPAPAVQHISTFRLHRMEHLHPSHLFSERLDGVNQKRAEFVRLEAPMMVCVKSVVANMSREDTGFITLL